MTSLTRLTAFAWLLVLGLLSAPRPADAQSFVSPLIGYDFGGDAKCLPIDNCTDKGLNFGVAFGALGRLLGLEEEIAYAKDFFGSTPDASSSVLTVMTNVMLAPDLKVVRPYALVGIGLIKTDFELTGASFLNEDNNTVGWNVGGGLMVSLAPHVAVRGDLRYFHSFQDLEFSETTIPDTKVNFGRAAAALVIKF